MVSPYLPMKTIVEIVEILQFLKGKVEMLKAWNVFFTPQMSTSHPRRLFKLSCAATHVINKPKPISESFYEPVLLIS